MMTLPYNLKQLVENNWLGVRLVWDSQPIEVSDGEATCRIEPNVVYPVTYFSLKYGKGIFQVDEDNSMVFSIDTDKLEFEDTHSETLN